MFPQWGILEDHGFREEARALVPDAVLLDTLLDAVEHVPGHDPRRGKHIGNGIWWIVAENWPGGGDVAIVYTFDTVNVTLHDIWERVAD